MLLNNIIRSHDLHAKSASTAASTRCGARVWVESICEGTACLPRVTLHQHNAMRRNTITTPACGKACLTPSCFNSQKCVRRASTPLFWFTCCCEYPPSHHSP